MKESENKAQTLQVDNTGFVKAKTRDWTDEEVAVAVEYLKREMPDEWAELEQLELTTGDLRNTRASATESVLLRKLHSERDPHEVSDLKFQVRVFRRCALGLG